MQDEGMMQDDKIEKEILKHVNEPDGRKELSCSDAFKIQDDLEIELLEIMKICSRSKIKITKCQLGCF